MANTDGAFGFRPINRDGSPYNGATLQCVFLADDATAAFIGDAVKLDGRSVDGYAGITQADAGDDIFGVVTAFAANPDSLSDQYRKASTKRKCQVTPALGTYFEVQDDGTITAASSGLNANFIQGSSGDTAYGVSGQEIDSTTEATTNTLDLQLVMPVDRADNDASTANSKWIVRFNVPQSAQGSTTGRTGV